MVLSQYFNDGTVSLDKHTEALDEHTEPYLLELRRSFEHLGDSMTVATKARVLAALWICEQRGECDQLFQSGALRPADVVKSLKLLDAPRLARQLERKVTKMTADGASPAKIRKVKQALQEAQQDMCTRKTQGSCSKAYVKRVRAWAKQIPTERLEYFLMHFPLEPWKVLCDLVHTHPEDWSLPYFQDVVHGGSPPEGSLVACALSMNVDNITEMLRTHSELPMYYSFIRNKIEPSKLPVGAKKELGRLAPLEDLLWFYEELRCDQVDQEVDKRLAGGERLHAIHNRSNFAKLMERMLVLRKYKAPFAHRLMPHAEERLSEVAALRAKFPPGFKCAVLGDASSSMSVAVQTATVLGSLLSVCLDADLRFFNSGDFKNAEHPPRTVEQVLHTAETVRASGSTSPAASLAPYYNSKTKVDLFVVVTDEEENTAVAIPGQTPKPRKDNTKRSRYGYGGGWGWGYGNDEGRFMFTELFKLYQADVNPDAQLVFVSFLRVGDEGQMVQELRDEEVEVTQFRLDGQRPDTSKFDKLLSVLQKTVGLEEEELEQETWVDVEVDQVAEELSRVPHPDLVA